MPPTRVDPRSEVGQWLDAFATAVRDRDYAAGRALCREDVQGFGTVADRYAGLDRLEDEQWRTVWDRTADFDFGIGTATCWNDDDLVVVMADWTSCGVEPDGSTRLREGRATIALTRDDGVLRAAHTHFSMSPGTLA